MHGGLVYAKSAFITPTQSSWHSGLLLFHMDFLEVASQRHSWDVDKTDEWIEFRPMAVAEAVLLVTPQIAMSLCAWANACNPILDQIILLTCRRRRYDNNGETFVGSSMPAPICHVQTVKPTPLK